MNLSLHATRAYAETAFPVSTGRSAEYRVIAQITSRLAQATRAANRDYPSFVRALNANRQMWTNFAIDLADTDNGLPAELRSRLFYLAEFTIEHTRKVLKKEAGVRTLIEINTAIMNGLSDKETS